MIDFQEVTGTQSEIDIQQMETDILEAGSRQEIDTQEAIETDTLMIVTLQDHHLYLLIDTRQGETAIPLKDLIHIQTHTRMKLIDTRLDPIKESIHQDIPPVIGTEFQSMQIGHQSIDTR